MDTKIKDYVNNAILLIRKYGAKYEYVDGLYKASKALLSQRDKSDMLAVLDYARRYCEEMIANLGYTCRTLELACLQNGVSAREIELWYSILLLMSPYRFDAYMLYLEKNRLPDERYYQPRKSCFDKIGVVQGLQDLEDDKLDILSISLPPGTGKTTLETFFTTWIIGKHPNDYSLFFSHSDDIDRMFYDAVLDITTSREYCWSEVFPDVKLRKSDAGRKQIDFNRTKPFWCIQCTSRFSNNAGVVRANRYLYCDDIVASISEAMNPAFLEKLWGIYAVDARQRKLNDQTKELHICTRWSVHDIVGRLKVMHEGNDRARFIAVSCYDDNGESNFQYDVNGMSTQFFKEQEAAMDEASFRALYMNEPIEREGLLFADDTLRRYLELPAEEPDEILGQCDCKSKGIDFMVMPSIRKYGNDYYVTDVVCSKDSDYEQQYRNLTRLIIETAMQNCEFESNQGGDRVALEVSNRVKESGWICNITDKPTETNKEARIYQCSGWIKQHLLFRDRSLYATKDDYGVFMQQLTSYTVAGKNPNDDVPDVLANFALRMQRKRNVAKLEVVHNPFRTGGIEDFFGGY